jgi:hypothetical protein
MRWAYLVRQESLLAVKIAFYYGDYDVYVHSNQPDQIVTVSSDRY